MEHLLDKITSILFGSKEDDISNLLDKNLDYVHRDAAAESLLKRKFDRDTIAAYLQVASDAEEFVDLLEECGEDLAIVWTELDLCPTPVEFISLRPAARVQAFNIIEARKPEWFPRLLYQGDGHLIQHKNSS